MPGDSSTDSSDTSAIAVQASIENSRIIAETASDAIITIDDASRILFVNRAAVTIFGYSIDEMLGAELTILMPEYLRHLHRTGLKNYLETGHKHISWEAVELPGLHKSGREISLELSFNEFRQDGRRFFTGIARDITKRKQDEHRLASLQKLTDLPLGQLSLAELLGEFLNRIQDSLKVDTVAILLLEVKGDELVAWAAQGLEEEVERGLRIPVGKGFAGKVVSEKRPIIIEDTSNADLYNPLLREKGIKSLLGVPLFVEGRPTGVLHVGSRRVAHFAEEDIRLLELAADRIALAIENARLYQVEREARAEAEAANQAKDEFLTILSHELRTPLTPIIGWVHMMQNGILADHEADKVLAVISRNAYHLKRLINDLLDMSAVLSGKMRIEETTVNVATVLQESIDTMRTFAGDLKVELVLDILSHDEKAIVKGDRNRLNQAFCNVIHNAIKFSSAGGYVHVSCENDDNDVVVRVEDQGTGIPTQFLPSVFERFRQADGSRTRTYGGLGLGLALVKSFVEAHRGEVIAESEGEGKGSAFTIRLPREVPGSEAARAQQQLNVERKKKPSRIMLVEDQQDTMEMLTAHFRNRGFEVLPCSSASEALQTAETRRFDILVSDVAMPEMDGLLLIRALRKKKGFEKIPAIALTGYASQNDADAAINAGFDQHLAKPIGPDELAAAVENLLASGNEPQR